MPPTKALNPLSPCPCGSQQALATCCLPYITRQRQPATAEALMRSRYSAHVLAAIDYLWDTWDSAQRSGSSPADILAWATSCEWRGLEILSTQAGTADDSEGIVTFIAHYQQQGIPHQHHEISRFKKLNKQWFYVSHC